MESSAWSNKVIKVIISLSFLSGTGGWVLVQSWSQESQCCKMELVPLVAHQTAVLLCPNLPYYLLLHCTLCSLVDIMWQRSWWVGPFPWGVYQQDPDQTTGKGPGV